MKIAIFSKLLITGAVSFMLVFPGEVSAGPLSFIRSVITAAAHVADAGENETFNSQTLPLLQPAVNLDPNPSKGGGDITVIDGIALMPESGPSGTIADIAERPSSSAISVYVVRPGDTLSEIASMFDVSVNTIVWANDIQRGVIRPGQTLVILPITGVRHTVAKGETIQSIAKKYKADLGEVLQYNDLEAGSKLAVGDTILIPDGEIAPAPARSSSGSTATLRGTSGPALSGFFIWPLAGGVKTQGLHGYNGIDIGAPRGTPIYASAAGVVIVSRSGGWNGGYGNYVVIDHGNGVQTLYAHNTNNAVAPGQGVAQGEIIGYVGSTGRSTGSHLHFEVRGAKQPY